MLQLSFRRQTTGSRLATLVAWATLASAACNAPDPRARPLLLTSADFASAASVDPNRSLAPGYGLPGGMPLHTILTTESGAPTLALRQTFTEGYRSAYVTTEIWGGFPAVWIQPVYVAVSGYAADGTPIRLAEPGERWHPIFSVGPGSAFYSPYWQEHTFEVPPGDDLASFTSVRDVLDRGLRVHAAGGRVMAIVPKSVEPPTPSAADSTAVQKIGGPTKETGWLGGAVVHFLDFGGKTFTWDNYGVVEEAPIFMWVARDANGALHALDIPTVAGVGPLYSNRQPQVVGVNGDVPHYGSYWRLYTVEVPPGAAVFAPSSRFPDVRNALADMPTLTAGTYDDAGINAAPPDLEDYVGRVALNPGCFASVDNILHKGGASNCYYLASQTDIEAQIPSDAIKKTDLLVTCPFVSYHGSAVAVSP